MKALFILSRALYMKALFILSRALYMNKSQGSLQIKGSHAVFFNFVSSQILTGLFSCWVGALCIKRVHAQYDWS